MVHRRFQSICIAFVNAIAVATAVAAPPAGGGAVSIAAAANLRYALEALNTEFRHENPTVTLTTAFGASGSLLAQIEHGAPFDIFLSADTTYPHQLALNGFADRSTLRTFAVGRLVLWTTRNDVEVTDINAAMRNPAVRKVAIARPETAPYGQAAQAALQSSHLWETVEPKIVVGENISQTAQFVETGNADAGFVALSLVVGSPTAVRGHWTEVPAALYAAVPLDHGCVLTAHGRDNDAARTYLDFLRGAGAKKILVQFGYAVPSEQ